MSEQTNNNDGAGAVDGRRRCHPPLSDEDRAHAMASREFMAVESEIQRRGLRPTRNLIWGLAIDKARLQIEVQKLRERLGEES